MHEFWHWIWSFVYSWYWLDRMRLYSSAVNLRRPSKRTMYSQSSQFHGGLTQSLGLRKCSRSQTSSYNVKLGLVDCSLHRNIKSSDRPSLRYFVSLVGRQFRCGLSGKEGSLNMKLDMPSRDNFSSMSWKWRGLHQKIGGTTSGLCLGFAVSGIANAEVPVEISISNSAASTSSTHGKEVYTDYSVTGGYSFF